MKGLIQKAAENFKADLELCNPCVLCVNSILQKAVNKTTSIVQNFGDFCQIYLVLRVAVDS